MAKMNLNVQLFNSASDEWFDEAQQRSLIDGVRKGLSSVIQGIERVGARLDQLTGQWHSEDAEKYGNPTAENFNSFAPAAVNYVKSVGDWMASHGSGVNIMQGNEIRYTNLDGQANSKVGTFTDNASRRGLENSETAEDTAKALQEGVSLIDDGLKQVVNAVTSNPDAMPKGVVPDSLEPVVRAENTKLSDSFGSLRDSMSETLRALHNAIVEASSRAAAATNGE